MLAIRYLRVSTDDQEGGLAMQDSITKMIAENKEIEVVATFQDDGISGGRDKQGNLKVRKGFDALKNFVKTQANTGLHIVVYDLSRIGRDPIVGEEFIQLCWKTETVVVDRTGTLHTFETYEKRLFARIMFAFNTGDKEKKNTDTMNGMKRAVEEGRWVMGVPIGYQYREAFIPKLNSKRKLLTPHPVTSSIIQKALNDFADGIIIGQSEFMRFLANNNIKSFKSNIKNVIANPLYAGLVEYKPWGIELRQGLHTPLISIETHEKILEKLNLKKKATYKSDLIDDFPLRRYVKCQECGNYITACWIKGRSKKYKSYFCCKKGCSEYKKHYNGDNLETQYEDLLKSIAPNQFILDTAKEVFEAQWDNRQEDQEQTRKNGFIELKKIDKEIERLWIKLKECTSQLISTKYEIEIESLENKKVKITIALNDISQNQVMTQVVYLTLVKRAFVLLKNPDKLWVLGSYKIRKLVFEIVFKELFVSANKKLLTPEFSLFYGIIKEFESKNVNWWTKVAPNSNNFESQLIEIIKSLQPRMEAVENEEWSLFL